ncbi:hypothetical protein CJ030_MR6G024473 [Morella rubra]|uniref:Uncharacterized protein n=1 Tax=Morella rubra TaxID=262757 RepID=A0A6A1VCE4_9ROSI|nr:hypothetical protein CJ030_MR6G024473 [Morella rubra]
MEELRKLEQVQRTLDFLESRGIATSSNRDSNRFIANLILLLVNDSHMERSVPSGDDFSCCVKFEQVSMMGVYTIFTGPYHRLCVDNSCCSSIVRIGKDTAMVGLEAMQRANSTLEDFCRSYFMFHGMNVNGPQSLFRYLPVLSFTESFIYQLDSLNEKILHLPTSGVTLPESEPKPGNQRLTTKFIDAFESNPFRPLTCLLECQGLLTERIGEEFRCGEEYWSLERKLCRALTSKEEISVEDVMKAIHLKSFDYRVLNLLLYQLRGEKDDVIENSFNVLRMFVRIYGASKAPTMLAKYITEAEKKYNILLKSLDPQLSLNYQKRCEEATKEGGKISGHRLGVWSIPPVIVDEELYRTNFLSSR